MDTRPTAEDRRAKRMNESPKFRQQVYFALEDIIHGGAVARVFGIMLFFLIVANAVLVFVLVQFGFSMTLGVRVFYTISTVCFFIEYIFRIWIADLLYPQFSINRARLHYMLSPFGIIDLLAFLPNMVAWFFPVTSALMNAVNVLRLMRLIKLTRYMRGLRTINRVIMKSRSEIIAAFMVIVMLIVVSSILMYEVESPVNHEFNSLFTGVYWAVTTITTTGYGDVVPITALGRALGALTMLLALACVAVPSGIISAGFVAEYQSIERQRHRSMDPSHKEGHGDSRGEYYEGPISESVNNSKGGTLNVAESRERTCAVVSTNGAADASRLTQPTSESQNAADGETGVNER